MSANQLPEKYIGKGGAVDKFSQTGAGQAIGAVSQAASAAGKALQASKNAGKGTLARPDEGALAIRDAQYAAAKSIPGPVGWIAGIAEGVDNILGGITGGLGSATKADKVLTSIPLLGNTAAIFAGKVDKIRGNVQDISTGDFGGSVAAFNDAQAMSGGKSLAARKLNKKVAEAQNQFNLTADIIDENKRLLNNNIGQDLLARNVSKYSGNQQFSLLGRKGMKFSSLDAARDLLKNKENKHAIGAGIVESMNSDPNLRNASTLVEFAGGLKDGLDEKDIKSLLENIALSNHPDAKTIQAINNNKEYLVKMFEDNGIGDYVSLLDNPDANYKDIVYIIDHIIHPKQFKSGGKIEKENIIPTGAMHKNLHHIEDVNPDLEGKITSKGIPVVTMDEGGEIKSQQAEIESNEWTLSLSVTQQIEEYWNNYKESKDDNIAIECGKYLVDQIFNNTRDDGKVIKKTE